MLASWPAGLVLPIAIMSSLDLSHSVLLGWSTCKFDLDDPCFGSRAAVAIDPIEDAIAIGI
ncbi:hypothetical protein [Mesorhizobium sp.]|uniref:hypothetical protein n=1 Tax=Mesorhizobium sp. TaxID=1871066 RepID=UPI0025FF653A|nr:hypothetical protein [Mesorhizobium sp.]